MAYILRIGSGYYLFAWMAGYPVFCDEKEDALRLTGDTIDENILSLTRMGYAVTSLQIA